MEPLLWTLNDVVRFIHHPDRPVRHWALERLTKLFLDQAGDALEEMLDDQDSYITHQAAEYLPRTPDAQRYASLLLERLKQAHGVLFGHVAQVLARLNYRAALPLILERLQPGQEPLDPNEALSIIDALGALGGDEARQALWAILNTLSKDEYPVGAVVNALLSTARPEDVDLLAQRYRALPPSKYPGRMMHSFASAVGALRLAQELEYAVKNGFDAAFERARNWLDQEPPLSQACLDDLAAAFGQDHVGVFDILLREARRLIEQRGDDVTGWRVAWEARNRPVGYRQEALLTLLILEAFAAHPSPYAEQRQDESGMGLALLCQLSIDRDDQARLDAAQDKTEMLLTILAEDRQNVLPTVVEQVAALGPDIVPRLIALLNPHRFSWAIVRVAEVIERIAHRYPGSCDAAIPALIEMINDEQGDYSLEACSSALEAIGPAAVGLVAEHMRDDDDTPQIYLTDVLGNIPTESAAQALITWIEEEGVTDEMQVNSLVDIGSPSAIELLYELWEPGDYLLSEALLTLCELNGVQKPELPEWRQVVQAQEARRSSMDGLIGSLVGRGEPVSTPHPAEPALRMAKPESGPPERFKLRSTRRPKSVSKKEQKKRAAHRKANAKKKRKKR